MSTSLNPVVLPDYTLLEPLYDFNNILERAIRKVFLLAGQQENAVIITETATDFQTIVPRFEIMVQVGSGLSRWVPVGPTQINHAWSAELTVQVVSHGDAKGKIVMAQNRVKARYICGMVNYLVNGQDCGLTKHKIASHLQPSGETQSYKDGDGYRYAQLKFHFNFSINPNELQALATPTQTIQ